MSTANWGISLRLAWRNLWRNKRRTWLTVSAMIFSNILLIFLITFQLGSYDIMINNTVRIMSGHLQVQHDGFNEDPRMRDTVPNAQMLADQLRQDLNTEQVSARAIAFALASSKERSYGVQVMGVEPRYEPGVSTIPSHLDRGRYFVDDNAAEIVLGAALARNLRVDIGSDITLLGSSPNGNLSAGIATVVGIFDSGVVDIDRGMVQLPIVYFQSVFEMGDAGHSVTAMAPGLKQVAEWQHTISASIADQPDLVALDWDALLPGLQQTIQADSDAFFFMYSVLVILVAFGVLNTQLMSVLERTREFGTMMSLGLSPGRLSRMVLTETALMALLGLTLGLLGGWLLVVSLQDSGIQLPAADETTSSLNFPTHIFPRIDSLSVLLGPLIVFNFSVVAALYPALRLFWLHPIKAMRTV